MANVQNALNSFHAWDQESGIAKAGAGKFPNPFCDIASEYVPRDLNTIFEWCTPAGTQVALDVYGRTAAIETVKIGDTVLAASGKILPVTDVMQHEVDEPLADLKVAGLFRRLRITRNHKLHIWRPGVDAPAYRLPWHLAESAITGIPAGDVKVGDWVCFPRAEYEIKGDWPYSMYICGMYLSEGCLIKRRLSDGQEHRRGVRFTLGSRERTLIDRLAQELTEYTGMRPVIRVSDDRPDVCTVTIFDPELADWLADNFGEYAWGKRIPDSVFHLPVSMRLEFIAAWLDGDGHVFRSRGHVKSVHGCSCCRDLIVQMCRLSESCGMYPNYHEKENTRFGSDVKEGSWLYRLDYYLADAAIVGPHMLKLAPGETVNGKARKDNVKATDHYVWRRVEDVGTVPFTGTVYNITVEGEHTYTVEGCAVFNCEYLMMAVAPFRTVSQRVVRYFLTDIVIEGQSDNEREQYEDFLNNQLHLIQQMAEIGDDYMCFHGDTKAVTRDGVFSLRDLEGKTVDVLSEGGVYRSAAFKRFGRQELMEVTFSDGRTVLATPEHQWHVLNCAGKRVKLPTSALKPRHRIERTVAARPEKNAEFEEGVRHGFVFGDGTRISKNRTCAYFCGAKDKAVMPYFKGIGTPARYDAKYNRWRVGGLPGHYKTLPANEASASYWYGFVCGFLAADGTVDTHGCVVLTQRSKATLEAIESQLPRIGMCAGPIRAQRRTTDLRPYNHNEHAVYDSTIHFMTLLKRFMCVDDLLIASHIDKFNAHKHTTDYGKYIAVKSVAATGMVDDVYCCVEMATHTFVIENGILTQNCYGNAFVSVFFPFDRFLICPKCKTTYHIETLHYKFEKSTGGFKCHCPKCDEERVMRREDRRSVDTTRVKIIRWSPKDIRLRVHPISGKIEYYLKLDSTYVSRLLDGEPFYLNDTPWDIIDACLKSDKSKKEYLFKFKDDSIYHMRCSTLAGLPVKGWAIPPILPNFKLAYYVQLLRRYDEAIALDFIIPFRILFPSNTSPQGQDALSTINMSSFIGHMQNMINSKRKNLTDIAVVPFSVGYQAMGGEARTLAPKDNIALAVDELLNSLGFPAELYKGTLSIQAFPVALRLFEKQWNSLVDGFNDFAAWLCKRLSRHFMWGEVDCTLRSVTLADDVERKAISLQAAAGQDISKQTAYRPLGIDYAEEQKRVVEEQAMVQKLQQEAMERQQAQQQGAGGGGGEGGQPAGATPGDVHEQAKALAQQLLIQTPETLRRGELIKIKHSNPTLHALVLQEMDTMRQDMARQGQAQVMQQMKQGEVIGYGPAASLPSPIRVGLMISDQLTEYNRDDLRKIAMDIHEHVPHADDAFRFVYRRMVGWI